MSDRDKVRQALREYFSKNHEPKPFIAGQTAVPASAKSLDENDILALGEAVMDLWLTGGRHTVAFEQKLAEQFKRPHALFVNSGSSANLLSIASLCAKGLKEKRLKPGDEVVTVAAGFPTTVNPILQNGLVPVFVDIELGTYNTTPERIEAAIGPKTRAIFAAHTLGNPFRADLVAKLAEKHGLYFIEDCCDALGAGISEKPVGSFGEMATVSFYPAHHITTGEGGAVILKDGKWKRIAESLRDWGRDCWCATGRENTCKRRFDFKLGELPHGYDHKYIYSEIGYNFKATDLQAALGVSQLAKLSAFHERRNQNFSMLHGLLSNSPISGRIELPRATSGTEPSWFGFPIRCLPGIERDKVIRGLTDARIGTRLLFAGNITRQPAYLDANARAAEPLTNSDIAMKEVFWIGVHPGLGRAEITYMAEKLCEITSRL